MKIYRIHLPLALIALVSCFCLSSCDSSEFNDDDLTPPATGSRMAKIKSVEYNPAPGQFVNEMPPYEAGDTPKSMNAKALDLINRGSLVSLGAFGGEITITLSEPIVYDAKAEADFRILGNSYIVGANGSINYGSSEPGMVWVMKDENGNGKADDTWYCFMGNMASQITYLTVTYRPASEPTSQSWVVWQTDDGQTGSLTCNTAYHDHTYFPEWLFDKPATAEMTVSGYAVPVNSFQEEYTRLFRQICYEGFADSFPNSDIRSAFSLRDVVDTKGKPVTLDRIDFIRVTTAVLDSNGPLGETSTEVGGIELLH